MLLVLPACDDWRGGGRWSFGEVRLDAPMVVAELTDGEENPPAEYIVDIVDEVAVLARPG